VHQQTGKTATSWIDISRVNMAKNLLQDKNIPIIDVAVAVGLDDQSYFSRFLKKLTGLTPSEYRKTF
jgi:AraC-like DNA-binding protein